MQYFIDLLRILYNIFWSYPCPLAPPRSTPTSPHIPQLHVLKKNQPINSNLSCPVWVWGHSLDYGPPTSSLIFRRCQPSTSVRDGGQWALPLFRLECWLTWVWLQISCHVPKTLFQFSPVQPLALITFLTCTPLHPLLLQWSLSPEVWHIYPLCLCLSTATATLCILISCEFLLSLPSAAPRSPSEEVWERHSVGPKIPFKVCHQWHR